MVLQATDTTLSSILPVRGGLKEAISLFTQLCSGVSHLHRNNMCYGIMSSRNIFITDRGPFLGIDHVFEVNRHLKLSI